MKRDNEITAPTTLVAIESTNDCTAMVRVGTSLHNAMLDGFKKEAKQLALNFAELEPQEQQDKRIAAITQKEWLVGIDMESSEGWQLIEIIEVLLYGHSNVKDQSRDDYYKGEGVNMVTANERSLPYVIINTSLREMVEIKNPGAAIGGKDLKAMEDVLVKYSDKTYLTKYREYYTEKEDAAKGKKKSKKPTHREVIEPCTLYHAKIIKDQGLNKSCVKLQLDRAFWEYITEHYYLKPIDFLSRVRKAYTEATGNSSAKMPEYLLPFLNELIRAQLYEGNTYHCTKQNLYKRINPSWYKARQWDKLDKLMQLFLKVAKRIGLLEKYWTAKSKTDGEEVLHCQVVKQENWK